MNEELKKALESAGTEEEIKKILSEHQLTEEDLKEIAGGEFPSYLLPMILPFPF